MVDLSRLFSRAWIRHPSPYATRRSELDALATGRKGMSMFDFAANDPGGFGRLFDQIHARGLVVVLSREGHAIVRKHVQGGTMYVVRPDQLWRVPAHIALNEAADQWDDTREAVQSWLLGYSARERSRWLAALRQRYPGNACAPVYALLSRSQKRAVVAAGKRYLGDVSKLIVFAHAEQLLLKPNATRLVPPGTTIARFGLAWPIYRRLFGGRRGVVRTAIPKKLERTFHAAMRSNVQFLTRRGWV